MTHIPGDKIPTALIRDPENRAKVLPEITPGCEWVFEGEGTPTRKWDGTCVMLDIHGKWWARREVKPGKSSPANYVPVHFDEVTGKIQGWEPIEQSAFRSAHAEAMRIRNQDTSGMIAGTYELAGPKINNNPEGFPYHMLLLHAQAPVIPDLHRMKMSPKMVMKIVGKIGIWPGWEGVVWHHPDGRMAKLKARDV